MILFENSILKLDYNPATDILEVNYPDLEGFLLLEIRHSIDRMIDIIKSYDIKKILLDSSRLHISVSEEEGRDIATYLAAGIMQTRVLMVARVQSGDSAIEKRAQGNVEHIKSSSSLPFQLQTFTDKQEALSWLLEN